MRFPARPTALALAICLTAPLTLDACGGGRRADAGSSAGSTRFDGAELPAGLRAPAFRLTDQAGRTVEINQYRARTVVLAFVSSACRACALVAQQVRGALDELDEGDIRTLFVSTDPRTDTPGARERFLGKASLRGRALYLSGPRADMRRVWHAYGVAPAHAGKSSSEAATSVLLIDRSGLERVAFGLEQLTPEALAHDLRALHGG